MIEQWHTLTLAAGSRPALILDTSESAKAVWPMIKSLTEGVLETLRQDCWPRIFFLGNPQPFDAAAFVANADQWFRANVGRGSVISPIFDVLETETDIAVVVVGNGLIFDLPDWHGHPLAERAVWCRYGPSSLTSGTYSEASYSVEQMAEKLHNPAVRIEVRGPSAMPVYWDDHSFRYEGGALVGEKTSGALTFGTLAPEPDTVTAHAVLSNGIRRNLELIATEPLRLPDWRNLTSKEDTLLRQCLRQGKYCCPHCSQDHPSGQWKCPDPAAPAIFRTLDEAGQSGFCLINTEPWQGLARPHPCSALQLADDLVAVRSASGQVVLMRFDSKGGRWLPTSEPFAPMHLVVNKIHALVV